MSVYEEFRKTVARVTRTAEQDIKADSFHWVQIFVALETALDADLDVDQDVMKELETVDDFVKYIEKMQ